MSKEIGGYFGFESFQGKEYYTGLTAVNSGRNALLYILKARNIQKLIIPRFLCDSISELCKREGYPYEEYAIDADFKPLFDRNLKPDEYLYIVNFYGQISNEDIWQMKQRWKNVVVDNVQAFFQRPVSGVDTVYSCRKFFGVPDGGYVATDAVFLGKLEVDRSKDRMKHVLGRFEETGAAYYADFRANDELFYGMPLMAMSPITHNILRGVNYAFVQRRRNENYSQLHQALGIKNKLQLTTPVGPYAYPFYCKNGMEVRKKLAAKGIYVATLWPNVLNLEGTLEQDYAQNILPLPCDQRYDMHDMNTIIDLLR